MEEVMVECSITSLSSPKAMQTSGVIFEDDDSSVAAFGSISSQAAHCSVPVSKEEAARETTLKLAGKKVCNEEPKDSFQSTVSEISDLGLCAICHDIILLEEVAQIKGCEHTYCVTCILRWASYKTDPWCPQCKRPFSFIFLYRALDGSLHDYMFEESVCLLLRASWFKPVPIETQEAFEEQDDYQYEDDIVEAYYYTSNVRLGNRRWGDSGYVRAGHKEARPVSVRQVHGTGSQIETGGSSSRSNKGKEISKEVAGRRARRAMKREAADKAAAAKHEQHLQRLGRK